MKKKMYCKRYNCKILATACIKRQRIARNKPKFGSINDWHGHYAITVSHCRDCVQGRDVKGKYYGKENSTG